MSENKIKWVNIFNALLVVALAIVFVALAITARLFAGQGFSLSLDNSVEEVCDGWVLLDESGGMTEIERTKAITLDGTDVTVSRIFIFGNDSTKNTLGFVSENCAVEVYQDGALVFSYGDPQAAAEGVMYGNYFCTVPLVAYMNQASEVDIRFVSNTPVVLNHFLIGDASSIASMRFMNSFGTLVFAVATFVIFIVLVVISFFGKRNVEISNFYYFFLIFLFLVVVWALSDIQLLSGFGVHPGFLCMVSYEAFMLLGFPFLMFIFYSYKSMRVFDLVGIAVMFVNFVMNNILHFSGVANMYQTNPISLVVLLACVVLVLVQSIVEYVRERSNISLSMIVCFGIMVVVTVLQIMAYFRHTTINNLHYVQFGLLAFILIQFISLIYYVFEVVKEGHKAEGYLSMAKTDVLTGLGNRRALDMYIADLAKNNLGSFRLGCIVCDMNDLKKTNDLYGHNEGDKLLKDFSQCLLDCFENRGIPFRTGGDEFYIMFSDVEVDMSAMMRRLELGMESVTLNGGTQMSCSSGCYADYVPAGNEDAIWDIIKMADSEMYKRKKLDREKRSRS